MMFDWNREMATDRPIPNVIPDMVLLVKKKKCAFVVDFALTLPENIASFIEEVKYNHLSATAVRIAKLFTT